MPKAVTPRSEDAERQRGPLADEILSAGHLRTKSGKRKSRSDEEDMDHYIDSKTSKRILQIGQDLADEEATESRTAIPSEEKNVDSAFDFGSRFRAEDMSEEEDDGIYGDEDQWGDEDEEVEEVVWLPHYDFGRPLRLGLTIQGDLPIPKCSC